jgi:hypothetical protein
LLREALRDSKNWLVTLKELNDFAGGKASRQRAAAPPFVIFKEINPGVYTQV